MDKLISIIVPCFNSEKTIATCLMSIKKQSYCNIEIIVIDDGSTDATVSIAKNLAKNDNRIKVYSKLNEGVSIARNYGIEKATGEYIGFVDADDTIICNMYEKMIFALENTQAGLVVCKYFTNKEKNIDDNFFWNKDQYIHEMFLPSCKIAAFVWNRLYRKEYIDKYSIRFHTDIKVCEDTLFNFEYLKNINSIYVVNESLYEYQINSNSAMFGDKFIANKLTAMEAYDIMLKQTENSVYKKCIQIACMWYAEILYMQIIKYHYDISSIERKRIKKSMKGNVIGFMKSNIPIKYKICYPLLLVR